MDTFETLQDFALNLLSDPRAHSAFEADPETALQAAGLGDVSALDVREILPLVLDYAPTQAVDLLSTQDALSVLGDSPVGLDALDTDLLGGDVLGGGNVLGNDVLGGDVLGGAGVGTALDGVQDLAAQGQVTDVVGDLTSGVDALDTTHLTSAVQDVTAGDLDVQHVLGGDLSGVTDNALHLTDIAQAGDVLSGVGHVGDITSGIGGVSGIGDISHVADLGHVDVGGILSGNDIAF